MLWGNRIGGLGVSLFTNVFRRNQNMEWTIQTSPHAAIKSLFFVTTNATAQNISSVVVIASTTLIQCHKCVLGFISLYPGNSQHLRTSE